MPDSHRVHCLHAPAATPRPLVLTGLVVWAMANSGGFLWLLSASATPGATSVREPTWPRDSQIVPDPARANLVVLVHPRCPCSRASVVELSEIMARCEGLVTAHVLFLKPSSMPDGWEVTDLWHRAASIPGARVRTDAEGREARRFGALTSGQVVLYDRNGLLKFSGGITIARGHRGENAGHQAIVDWLTHGTAERSSEVVFGCPVFSDRSLAGEVKR